jgi:hypothetical protein
MGLLQSIDRLVGRFNRWFGGAPAAAQAESPAGPTQVRTMAAANVAEDVEEATSLETPGGADAEAESQSRPTE